MVTAWWNAFADAGHTVAMADVHRRIGMGGARLVADLLGKPDEDVQTGWARYYAPNLQRLRPLPRASELLRAVHGRGLAVVLATSSPPEHAQAARAALAVGAIVAATTSADDAEESKPEPDILGAALSAAGLSAADAVAVGDAVWDVEAARRAGLPCVGVLSGGIGRAELEQAGAVAVYDDVADLLVHLDSSPLG